MAVHIDVALDVDEAMMERVHLRHEERQRTQVRPFGGEELARTGVQDGAWAPRSPCRRRRAPGH